jgi:hypothetical protein
MQPNAPPPRDGPPDDDIDAALRDGLKSRSLSAGALQRIRAAVEGEWRSMVSASASATLAPAARPVWAWLAAAALAAVAVSVSWLAVLDYQGPSSTESLATLVRAEAPGVRERRVVLADRPLAAGDSARAGQRLEFAGGALLALGGGATLRVAPASRVMVLDANKLALQRGEVYVDLPVGANRSLVIATDDGEFRHLGTQFAVARLRDSTRLRVREGRVSWQSGAAQEIGEAGTQVAIRKGRVQAREALSLAGADWQWVEALAPEFAIENRPLLDYLLWVARETGRALQFSDAEARSQAAVIVLHGSVRGLAPRQALARIMATTRLQHEWTESAIRVSLPREEV